MDVEQYEADAECKKICPNEKVIDVVLVQSDFFVVWHIWVNYCVSKVIRKLVSTVGDPKYHVPKELTLALTLLLHFQFDSVPFRYRC